MGLLCLLCASVVNCAALDREAFSITTYDLNLQIEPEQHRLGVRGKVTLRNDSPTPQKIAVLQISSSLDWKSIALIDKTGDKPLQFVAQPYASDIDHTGGLSEAIVTLPQAVSPKGIVELQIAYEGVILLDATRLTRIGTPDDVATSSDWDQISSSFTGLRGVGYVAWYPIATEVANLSEGNSLFDALGRWKARETDFRMRVRVELTRPAKDAPPEILFGGRKCSGGDDRAGMIERAIVSCPDASLRLSAPSLFIAHYATLDRPAVAVHYLPIHEAAAMQYADETEKLASLIVDWFGPPREKASIADLPDPNATPFESGALLLTPLASADPKSVGLAAAHQLTHASFLSFRPWIEEGLAHFAQALYIEQQSGRQAALDYMASHRASFEDPQPSAPRSEDEVNHSLVNTTSEELYRSKAMSVWWMLRDMVGDAALKKALAAYRLEQDKEPSYMQQLIAAQTQRDLEWFFDDWVYRDRGLPDFEVESAFSRKMLNNSFMVAITVDNMGGAGAEVPIIVKFAGGTVTKRLEVRAKSKATIRVETSSEAQEIVVNDGSVPESDMTNNVFKVVPEDSSN